jgi:hypothetical protein
MKPALPSSSASWNLSKGYLDAGNAVHDLIRSGTYTGFAYLPCLFLYFRCIELALKAVLVPAGISEGEIARTLGHRISQLLRKTEKFTALSKLGIFAKDRKLLDRFSDDYSDKWFEYPNSLSRPNPHIDQMRDLAHRVCNAVRRHGRPRGLTRR